MNPPLYRPGARVNVRLLLAAAVAGAMPGSSQALERAIPMLDTASMEPPVKALIETTTRNLENAMDSAYAWGQLGRVFHAHDLHRAAIECYEHAIQLDRSNIHWPYLAAHAQSRFNTEASISLFEAAAALQPDNHALFIAYGDTLAQLGRHDAARDAYRSALRIDDHSSFALVGLGRQALIDGDLAQARSLLEQARDRAPRDGDIHTLLAQIYMREGETELASRAELFAKAYADPLSTDDAVLQAMKDLAVNAGTYAARGAELAKRRNFAAAEIQLRKVLAIRPGTPADLGNLASVLARQGKHREAFQYFDKGLAHDPNNVVLLSHQGLAFLATGQLDRATAPLTKAVALDPTYPEAQFNLGVLRYRQGRSRDAISRFERTLALQPGLTDAYLNLGSAYAAAGDLERALEPWMQLQQLQPDNAALVYNIAMARARLGHHAGAIAEFERGMGLAPTDPRFAAALARELATAPEPGLRDGARALVLATGLVEARPRDPVAHELMAAALAETGQFEASIRHAERALAMASGNPRLVNEIRARLSLYRRGEPFRQRPSPRDHPKQ